MAIIAINKGIKGAISWSLQPFPERQNPANHGKATFRRIRARRVTLGNSVPSVPEAMDDDFSVQSLPSSLNTTEEEDQTAITIHELAPPNTPQYSEDEY